MKRLLQTINTKWNTIFLRNFGGVQGEEQIHSILNQTFPRAKEITVKDVSGGCGAMYQVFVEAPEFKGLKILDQHRLALKEEMKNMHGLTVKTKEAS